MLKLVARLLSTPQEVVALSFARMADALGNSMLVIVLPIFIARQPSAALGALPEELQVGLVISLFGVLFALSQPITGALSDRTGRRKPFVVSGLVLMALATLSFTLADSYLSIVVLRGLQGIGVALVVPAVLALITSATRPRTRGNAMGVYSTFRMVGFASGPLLGGLLLVNTGFNAVFIVGAGFVLAALLLVLFTVSEQASLRAPEKPRDAESDEHLWTGCIDEDSIGRYEDCVPEPGPAIGMSQGGDDAFGSKHQSNREPTAPEPGNTGVAPSSGRAALGERVRQEEHEHQEQPRAERQRDQGTGDRKSWLPSPSMIALMFSSIVLASSLSMIASLENVFNERLSQTALGFGVAFSALTVSRLIVQIPLGRLSDDIGRKKLIVGGLIALAPITALFGHVGSTLQLVGLRLLQGVATAGIAAPSFALAGDLAREGGEGREMSLVTMGFGLGLATGPTVTGFLAGYLGFAVPFYVFAGFSLLAAGTVWFFAKESVGPEALKMDRRSRSDDT